MITTTTSEAARSFHVLTVHFYGHSTTHWYFAPVWEAILGAALLGTVVIASRRGAIAFIAGAHGPAAAECFSLAPGQ